jgi:hypothetical protein
MVGERQTYMMDVPKMAKKLTDLGFIELFHRLTPEALESIWNLPGAAKTLEQVAVNPDVSKLASFLAAEILFRKQADYPPAQAKQQLAETYAIALASNYPQLTNAWGMPGRLDGLAGQHLVALGEAIVPDLNPLLKNATAMIYSGSREASEGNRFHYRVKDFAAFFISQILGLHFEVHEDPSRRDEEIKRLQKMLSAK